MKTLALAGDKTITENIVYEMLRWMFEKWLKEDTCPVILWAVVDANVVKEANEVLPKTYEGFEKWLRKIGLIYTLEMEIGFWTVTGTQNHPEGDLVYSYNQAREFISYAAENNLDIETLGD